MVNRRYRRRQEKNEKPHRLDAMRQREVVKWSDLKKLSDDTVGVVTSALSTLRAGFDDVVASDEVTANDIAMAKEMSTQMSTVENSSMETMEMINNTCDKYDDDIVSPDDTSKYLDLVSVIDAKTIEVTAITEHIVKTMDEMSKKHPKEQTNE